METDIAIDKRLTETVAVLLKKDVVQLERLPGGKNSRVYKAVSDGNSEYAVKLYFCHPEDPRNRIAVEFEAFSRLWDEGFRQIPQPLAMDASVGCVVYSFVRGDKILSVDISRTDIDQALQFLKKLNVLAREVPMQAFQAASEANFSMEKIVKNILFYLCIWFEPERTN